MQAGEILHIQTVQEIYREKGLQGEKGFLERCCVRKWESQEKPLKIMSC